MTQPGLLAHLPARFTRSEEDLATESLVFFCGHVRLRQPAFVRAYMNSARSRPAAERPARRRGPASSETRSLMEVDDLEVEGELVMV
jgi:hypothetical protein